METDAQTVTIGSEDRARQHYLHVVMKGASTHRLRAVNVDVLGRWLAHRSLAASAIFLLPLAAA